MIPKFEKPSHSFVELVESNPMVYNTFHFDQYSHLSIHLNSFRFLAKISKTNSKFEKKFSIGL